MERTTKTALMQFQQFKQFQRYAEESKVIRQHIHQYPELGYQEHLTAKLVAEKLEAWGYKVTRGVGKTGVVGQLKVGNASQSIGIRADMDALPILENSNLPYNSVHAGVMHACGHDGHTAMLLGAAHCLADNKNFNGTLNVIFQPAEEGLAGAKCMIDEGLFELFPCDVIYAMHNMPGYPAGQLIFGAGPFMASGDTVTITIHGKGGHGAMPKGTVDAVIVGSHIVLALQSIVSRNLDPQDVAVISIGSFQSGDACNIIADSAILKLTVRTLDPQVRHFLSERISLVANAQAASFGATVSINYDFTYPVLVNDVKATQFAKEVALSLRDDTDVIDMPLPLLTSEDFAFMLEKCPGSYLLLGNGCHDQSHRLHHPHYDFNDEILLPGIAYWNQLVTTFLKN